MLKSSANWAKLPHSPRKMKSQITPLWLRDCLIFLCQLTTEWNFYPDKELKSCFSTLCTLSLEPFISNSAKWVCILAFFSHCRIKFWKSEKKEGTKSKLASHGQSLHFNASFARINFLSSTLCIDFLEAAYLLFITPTSYHVAPMWFHWNVYSTP